MQASARITVFLFTDIEGSTRLWEQQPERMRPALAHHDAIARAAVENHHGTVVKMSGDGIHAAFDDPLDALNACLELQHTLADPARTNGIALRARCGLHAGVDERRDNDFFGRSVNRAARIMSAAHGGQILVSEAVAALLRDRLPESVSLSDLGSVRLRDLESPERIYQIAHPELQHAFPPLRSLEDTPNNLPQQVTSFIGRDRELAEVKILLAKTRLLTLVGVGGIGKTRLSLQAAADAMDEFPDGVWFVELAPLTDAQRVPQTVASLLGVKEEAGRPVIEALLKYVKDRQLLLVVDNCEHLTQACAELASQLLQSAPRVKLLATSREHLRTSGEYVYAVPALSLPDPQSAITSESLAQFEAARLFVERAVAAQPAFEASDRNAPAVVDICRRLDGIPLAIELAAARVRALSLDTIAARLSDRFRLLGGGDRAALPRQQTLRALIDWSYELLSEPERAVLRRLAVFAGGWTLEAAEAVVIDGDVKQPAVLDLLTRLVERSLVVWDPENGRYRLLETVRQYARERLNDSEEEGQTRARHLTFYLAVAENAGAELAGPEQLRWLSHLDVDRENLLTALAAARESREADSGYRLVHAIKLYWFMRGLLDLGYRATVEAISVPTTQPHSLSRCRALWVAGQICSYTGRYTEAQQYLHESLAIARHHDDRRMIATVQNYLALAALGQGDRAAAQVHCKGALDLARELGNKREIAVASNALAQLNRLDGKLDGAEPLYEEVVTLARELHDQEFEAIGILGLAMVATMRDLAVRARDLLREVLTIADKTGSKTAGQSALEVSAGLAALEKDWERSARLYGAAEAQTLRTGIRRDPADEGFLQPLLARAREALGESRFALAEASGRALPVEQAIEDVRLWLSSSTGGP
ncbi:MAG TPA: adenylate/guanylate cyclase domain-containing protein [Casimicrobiaceae bacterium]|nr:adenylate/guanylate cyclase domain-containing protein [Casimicrobiaceae bacterium]